MTLNVRNYETELRDVFEEVTETKIGTKWVILEYEGNSNILKVGDKGDGGLEEFSRGFDANKLQYGIIGVHVPNLANPKILFIQWQGEGVPIHRITATTAHMDNVKGFFKTIHVTMFARCEFDVETETLRGVVRSLTNGTDAVLPDAAPQEFVQPGPVGSAYEPVKASVDLASREQFWKDQDKQEEVRLAEERKRQEEERKRYEKDREALIRTCKVAVTGRIEKPMPYRTEQPVGADSKSLVSGRTKMFQTIADQQAPSATPTRPSLVSGRAKMFQKMAERHAASAASATPPRKPLNTTPKPWEVKKQAASIPATTSNASYMRQEAPPVVPTEPTPAAPAQDPTIPPPLPETSPPRMPTSVPPPEIEETHTNGNGTASSDVPPPLPTSQPPSEPVSYYPSQLDGTRAIAMWDYQAEEDNEISFDPNDIITEIEEVDEGWWRGRAPNGALGLFPANYVKLL